MSEYDHCYECLMYGDNYGYDDNGNLISLCADCMDRKKKDDDERRAADCWGCKCPKMERLTERRD